MAGSQRSTFRDAFHASLSTPRTPEQNNDRGAFPTRAAPIHREIPMPENKTTKPMSHVLVVSADPGWRDEVVAGINTAAQKLDNPFDLLAVPATDAGAAISCVRADGDVQIVLIDHGDHAPPAKSGKGA